ncbi:MAG: alpha-amylase family glycosyl hydrolase, partial [Woeseiaceae bacterium]
MNKRTIAAAAFAALTLAGCGTVQEANGVVDAPVEYFGTLEPFASEAVYFIVTDRFVDGDPANNFPDQGGVERGTFDRPIRVADSAPANIGYLGGDFRGVLDNADYIADMGFTAIWLTPIVDNPDEAFTGGTAPGEGGSNDYGKTGYHGYWGVNFFALDEHLPSANL